LHFIETTGAEKSRTVLFNLVKNSCINPASAYATFFSLILLLLG